MGYIAAGIAALGFRTEPGLALILQNLVLNFGVVTAVWGLAEITRTALLRHRAERDVSPWLVLLVGGGLGIAAHVTHKIGSVPLGLPYPPVTGLSLSVSALAGAALIVVSALVDEADAAGVGELLRSASQVFDELQLRVERVFRESAPDAPSSTVLENVIDTAIKPISRELLRANSARKELLFVRGAIRNQLAFDPFVKPWWIAFLYACSLIVVNNILFPGSERALASLPAAGFAFFLVGGWITLAYRLMAPRFRLVTSRTFLVYFGSFLPLAVGQTLINQSLFEPPLELATVLPGVVLNYLSLISLSLLFSLSSQDSTERSRGRFVWSTSGETTSWMRGEWGRATVQAILRNVMHHLHGTVQNRVLALRLSAGSQSAKSHRALEKAISEIIAQAKADFQSSQARPFQDRVESLIAEWKPIANVTVNSRLRDMSDLREAVLFMVIQEAVTNSIRHGMARSVTVSLDAHESDRRVLLDVVDDGTGPARKVRNLGVGLGFLAALSEGAWSLDTRPGGGSRLTALLWC
jgi:signal transduction histidine kinase